MRFKRESSVDDNIYLSHIEQEGWNDIRAYHLANESAWRMVAILAIITLMFVAIYAMYIVNQDKHKTLVFEKDTLGNITTLGLASKSFNVDNKVIAHQLANFIIALREVPKDTMLKRRNINLVHKMIESKIRGQIDHLLIEHYTLAGDRQVIVEISSLAPLEGGKSWSVHWFEDILNSSGESVKRQSYSSVVTFTKADMIDPEIQLTNPIGLFISYIHPVEDIHDAAI